jgi:hypothetical protein
MSSMSTMLAVAALLGLLTLSACVTVVHDDPPYYAHGYYYDYPTCHRC